MRTGTLSAHLEVIRAIEQAVADNWDIAGRSATGEAARAQEELCRQPERYVRLADRTAAARARQPSRAFSWIHGRTV